MTKHYKGWYGITAKITTDSNGEASLIVKASGKTTLNKRYKSEAVARRVLSRVSDGTAHEV